MTKYLEQTLRRQAQIFDHSLILTPVDNFPPFSKYDSSVRWTHGLYISDKVKSLNESKDSIIQFSGRSKLTASVNNIHSIFAERFGGSNSSLRLLSGLHAHTVVFMGLANIGDRVSLLPEEAGGHFATEGILKRLGLIVDHLPIDKDRCCVDRKKAIDKLSRNPPDILFLDRSEGLLYEDFSWVNDLKIPLKIFDSSQYATQILSGTYTNPFDWGFDLQILSLHKSFPGPQKAAIVAKDTKHWSAVESCLSSYVSSAHIENTFLAGLILEEKQSLDLYANRLQNVALELEQELHKCGVNVVRRELLSNLTLTGTQHIWIRMTTKEMAFSAWRKLENNRIQCNYRKLPYDLGWGLRLGVTAAVSRGITVDECEDVAEIISKIILGENTRRYRRAVSDIVMNMRKNMPFEYTNE